MKALPNMSHANNANIAKSGWDWSNQERWPTNTLFQLSSHKKQQNDYSSWSGQHIYWYLQTRMRKNSHWDGSMRKDIANKPDDLTSILRPCGRRKKKSTTFSCLLTFIYIHKFIQYTQNNYKKIWKKILYLHNIFHNQSTKVYRLIFFSSPLILNHF